jgi:hypothetical protein
MPEPETRIEHATEPTAEEVLENDEAGVPLTAAAGSS